MYKDFVKEFAEKTRKNLDFIEKNQPDFKITQLVNSCLGLIAFPRKKCFDQIPKTQLDNLTSQGWPIPENEGGFPPARNLKDLIRHLRNGITHGNLEFYDDAKNEIESILVWDEDGNNTHNKNWQVRFQMDDLRKFVTKFSDMLIDGEYCSGCNGC